MTATEGYGRVRCPKCKEFYDMDSAHACGATIQLTRGFVALVDAEDYGSVMAFAPWHVKIEDHTAYAGHRYRGPDGRVRVIRLHTFLTGWGYVDHINGDGLDNRRSNLRRASHTENMWNRGPQANNTSGFKGVVWRKDRSRWTARITAAGETRYLGNWSTPEAAALAYDAAARELHGEFARLNFPGVPA